MGLYCKDNVTPCMGVWIEIINSTNDAPHNFVTPCMGVWIEILPLLDKHH